MELFVIKSNDDSVYFQLENCNEALSVLNYVSQKLFDDVEFMKNVDVEIKKNFRIPRTEWHSKGEIFSSVVIDTEYIYLVIKGLKSSLKDEIIYHICDVHDSTINDGRHICVKV